MRGCPGPRPVRKDRSKNPAQNPITITTQTPQTLTTSLQIAFGMTLFAAASGRVFALIASDPAQETAVLFAALLATLNALVALFLTHVAGKRRTTRAFFAAVFGGMLARMGATLLGFIIGLKVLALPAPALAGALLGYTLLFTAIEVSLWSRQSFSPQVQLS